MSTASSHPESNPWWFAIDRPDPRDERVLEHQIAATRPAPLVTNESDGQAETRAHPALGLRLVSRRYTAGRSARTKLFRKWRNWWIDCQTDTRRVVLPLQTRHEHIARIRQDEIESLLDARGELDPDELVTS
jgi:hypothetical protein